MEDPHPPKGNWDARAVIALVVIVLSFALAAIHLIVSPGEAQTIPAWVAALVGGIGLYYYKNGKGGT